MTRRFHENEVPARSGGTGARPFAFARSVAVALMAMAAAWAPTSTRAQQPPPGTPSWEISSASYIWAAGMRGNLATLPPAPAVSVNIGFDKVLQNLDGGIMTAAEFRFGRTMFVADILFAKLSAGVNPKGPGFSSVSMETSSLVATLAAGYRVIDDERLKLDAYLGLRGVTVWTEITTTSLIPALNIVKGETEGWVDPVVGMKLKYALNDAWYLSAWGFVGGFGVSSNLTWDAFAGVGYVINPKMSVLAGYRGLGIDYKANGYVYDVVQHGPLVAFIARF